ncbi:MAG: alpha/beta hydrolase [Gammaproteobacteria bacterium]|nr:alpha/beta hydrolase [Gammaproteobacteria bacterium]
MSYSEHHYRSNDGLKLYYRVYGSNENVLICLPGLTRNCKDFEKLAEHLASGWTVITPDLRGRGQSEHDPKFRNYRPGTYVSDTWSLLDSLGLTRVVVIGTSLGGLMAMIMADQQPQRIRAVVLNDVGPELPPAAVARILTYAGRTPPADNWDLASEQVRQAYALAYPKESADFWRDFTRLSYRQVDSGKVEPDIDPAIGEALRKSRGILKFLQWLRKHGLKRKVGGVNIDTWDSFRAISMPCLLLHGEISDVLTPEIVGRMIAVNPQLQVCTVPDRGHAPSLDEPVARSAIDGFLDRILQTMA